MRNKNIIFIYSNRVQPLIFYLVASSSSQIALNNVSKNLGNVLESVAENTDSGQNKDVRTTSSRNQNLTKTSCERCKGMYAIRKRHLY